MKVRTAPLSPVDAIAASAATSAGLPSAMLPTDTHTADGAAEAVRGRHGGGAGGRAGHGDERERWDGHREPGELRREVVDPSRPRG